MDKEEAIKHIMNHPATAKLAGPAGKPDWGKIAGLVIKFIELIVGSGLIPTG